MMPSSRPASDESSLPQTLTWVMLGAGVVLGGLAGYEASELLSAEREISRARTWNTQLADREHDGQRAETLLWVFGLNSATLLGGALFVHLLAAPGPAPERRATSRVRPSARGIELRF
jgi:hypothetical protein